MWRFVIAGSVGAAVGLMVVFGTAWLMAPDDGSTSGASTEQRSMGLASWSAWDERSLTMSAARAGFAHSSDIKGNVDSAIRLPDGQVRIFGWVVDVAGNGSPLTVIAFADTEAKLEARTQGSRPDVAANLKLPPEKTAHVAFEGTLSCKKGQGILVAAISQNNRFAPLPARSCP
jgi:hypothetical protein